MSLISTTTRWTYGLLQYSISRVHQFNSLRNGKCYAMRMKTGSLRFEAEAVKQRTMCTDKGNPFGKRVVRPTNFQKKVLVWNRTYPSLEAVPKEVTHTQILVAKDWFRIRANIGMAFVTVFMCMVMVYLGRKGRREGLTFTNRNNARHQKYREAAAASGTKNET